MFYHSERMTVTFFEKLRKVEVDMTVRWTENACNNACKNNWKSEERISGKALQDLNLK